MAPNQVDVGTPGEAEANFHSADSNCVNHAALSRFDEKLKDELTQILNIDLSDNQRTQEMLPI